tara:strand:- start:74 stop:376 length:303 start_codon:yes stop_codon:yes gene_type:complete
MENMIHDYDPSFSPIEAFEGDDRPDCMNCCDSGTFYNDAGIKEFCDCGAGIACAENAQDHLGRMEEDDYLDDCYDDEDAFASAGWGMDESYGGYDYDDWN